MELVTGYLKIELLNGQDLDFINKEGYDIKKQIYDKWKNGEIKDFNGQPIHDIHFSFLVQSLVQS